MILKMAFRNLARMKVRTILYFTVIFLLVLSVTASLLILGVTANAVTELDENYMFAASMVPRRKDELRLSDVQYGYSSPEVQGFNISMSEYDGVLPGDPYTLRNHPRDGEQPKQGNLYVEAENCVLTATENLYLQPPFYSGECRIVEGTGITHDGYTGNKREVVVPKWFAEKHGLSVGETVLSRFYGNQEYRFFDTEVVGIYDTSKLFAKNREYPAYIPMAIAEVEYCAMLPKSYFTTKDIVIERADFFLKGRDSFEPFFSHVKEQGLNFKNINLIFNNNAYDSLRSDLRNIHEIALFVCLTVLFVGGGILIFFTAYLITSRKGERQLLRSLGMPKGKVAAMLATELAVLILFSTAIGVGVGFATANGICNKVNDSVLVESDASERIQITQSNDLFSPALEQEIRMQLSVNGVSVKKTDIPINQTLTPKSDEVGISTHAFYHFPDYETKWGSEWEPFRLVGITDLSAVKTSISREEIENLPNYHEKFIYAYVSESSGFYTGGKTKAYYFTRFPDNSVSSITAVGVTTMDIFGTYVIIAGTYEDNPYCSGNDVLLDMEDYHKIYRRCSITDENFYFKRIHTVVKKEEP